MIGAFTFGSITVGGRRYGSDVKIVAGRVKADWWREAGHRVEAGDLDDILQDAPEVIVIGRGDPGRMRVGASLRQCAAERGIELIEETTPRAVLTFNRLLREGRRVAGGFHVGC